MRNENRLWWPGFLSDQDKTSKLCNGPSMYASIWPRGFREEDENGKVIKKLMPSVTKAL